MDEDELRSLKSEQGEPCLSELINMVLQKS